MTKTNPPQRKIIHVDMDCFYAAVEMRDDPSLRGIPIAVGGASDRRGVISTADQKHHRQRLGYHAMRDHHASPPPRKNNPYRHE